MHFHICLCTHTAYNVLCTGHTQFAHIHKFIFIQKCTYTKPWQPDSFYPPFGRALHIQQTYFPFSFDLNTHTHAHTRWLADRSKVCCSFWIDPLWYQSAKRSVHLCAKSSSSTSSSLFDCEFKSRNLTRQNENWFYFQHIPSHFVLKKRVCVLTRLNHAKSFHTTLTDWKCKNYEYWIRIDIYASGHFTSRCFSMWIQAIVACCAVQCHWVAFYAIDVAISVCPLMYYISWKTIMHDARHTL